MASYRIYCNACLRRYLATWRRTRTCTTAFEEVTNFLAESVTTSLELIAARIKNVKATNRDSPVQYSTFVANDQVERSIVILPSMLTLINSPLLLDNLCKAPLALGISQVLQHLQSMMTEEWDDIRKILFVLLEAFSHNPNLLLHEKQRSIVIRCFVAISNTVVGR